MSDSGMDFGLSSSDRQFREELRSFLRENPPASHSGTFEAGLAWQKVLHTGGWVAPHWPRSFGGRGATPAQYAIYWTEMAAAGAPQIANRVGVQTAGPTLLAHGTAEQKSRYLEPMLAGEEIWRQLFSEPDAGSDLGGLRTTAVLDGDTWIVRGQKVWTSFGAQSKFGLLLARTEGADAPGVRGLTCFVCNLDQPGASARPLTQMTGDTEFSEVFLDDVRLPADAVIGERGRGWAVASSALGSERGVAFPMKEQMVLGARLNELTERFRAQRHHDPVLRLRVVDDVILSEIFRLLNLRTLTMVARGEEIGMWSSLIKLSWSQLAQHLSETALDAHGLAGIAGDPDLSFEFLRYRMASIAGGTSEIQRNIVAERILGLPR